MPKGEPDQRTHYDIEGIGPSDVLARVLRRDVETLSKKDRKMLRAALLAILEDRRLDLYTSEFRQYRRDRLDTDQWAVFEYMMWVELPDEPIGPLVATGADYANMLRTDRLAIAATVLLGLHANVMPDHDRLPRSGDLAFDLSAYAAEYERGLRLEGMVNLVEAALDDGPPKLVAHEGIVQIEPWKPTPGYVPASKIRHRDQPTPPSTLNGWRNKNPATFERYPATGEWFHPADWVKERLTKYRPWHNPPNRNSSPKSD